MLLGVAFAWAIGSDAASRLCSIVKGASGTFYAWIRLPVAMALAGGLLGAALLYSQANPVVVIVLMCAAGIVMVPLTTSPTQKIWLRIPALLLGGVLFFLAVGGMISTDIIASNRYGGRFVELSVTAFVILLVAMFWLSKGWRLIEAGIGAQPLSETTVLTPPRGWMWGHYVSLFLGIIVLTLWLGLLAWLASSAWSYAPERVTTIKGSNNLLAQVGFIMLLAWWPYRSWRAILGREPNSEAKYLRRHRRVTTIVGMAFVTILALSLTYGIQSGND